MTFSLKYCDTNYKANWSEAKYIYIECKLNANPSKKDLSHIKKEKRGRRQEIHGQNKKKFATVSPTAGDRVYRVRETSRRYRSTIGWCKYSADSHDGKAGTRKNSDLEVCKYNESSPSSSGRQADYSHKAEKRKEWSWSEERGRDVEG